MAEPPQLPRRQPNVDLSIAARPVENTNISNVDNRWYVDERTLMVLLNCLRRWQVRS